ncbi:unnamed protein product, partial [Gongylonema pulchrum]
MVFSKPSLQNITDFSKPESILTLFLSYRPLIGTTNLTIAGDIALLDGSRQLFVVPYRGIYTTSAVFDFHITVRDELSARDPAHFVDDAQIIL